MSKWILKVLAYPYSAYANETVITLKPEQLNTFLKMVDLLEELDDVQEVYHNVNIPEMDNEDE